MTLSRLPVLIGQTQQRETFLTCKVTHLHAHCDAAVLGYDAIYIILNHAFLQLLTLSEREKPSLEVTRTTVLRI